MWFFLIHKGLKCCMFCKRMVYYYRLRKRLRNGAGSLHKPNQIKILIVLNRGGIGNIIEATPLIQAVRSCFLSGKIYLVTSKPELFENWCIPTQVVSDPADLKETTFDYTYLPYWEWRSLPQWDHVRNFGKVLMLGALQTQWFLKSESQTYLDLAKRTGYRGNPPPLYVPVKRPKRELPEDYICIVPGGKNEYLWRHKQWPYYEDLIEHIVQAYPRLFICIIGTQEDELPKATSNVIDLRGKLTLPELAWVLKRAHLVIGNDCGPMHVAAALNVPSIVIFGPACIIKNSYIGTALTLCAGNLKCWPCQYSFEQLKKCKKGVCIESITPEKVMNTMKECFELR